MIPALIILTSIAAGLRFYHLGFKSLWYDEANTWILVQGSFREILELNATLNSAPPLYPLLLGLVTGPDASEAALRLPAAIAGIAAVPLVWLLAREFVSGWPSLLAPLLVAVAPTQVEYSQQVREYSLAFCAASLILIAAVRFVRAPGTGRALALGFGGALGLLIQYGIGLLVAGVALICLVVLLAGNKAGTSRRQLLAWWGFAQVPAAFVAVALAVTTLPSQLAAVSPGTGGYLAPFYWDGTGPGLWVLLTGDRADIVHFAFPSKLMAALVIGGLAAWCWEARRLAPLPLLALALLLVPIGLTVGTALLGLYPYGGIRQDLFLLPMVYVAAASGLAWIARQLARLPPHASGAAAPLAVATTVAFAAVGLPRTVALLRSTGAEPMRPVAAALAREIRPADRIYVHDGAVPAFRYYWRGRPEPWVAGAPHGAGLDPGIAASRLPAIQQELEALLGGPARWWIVISHVTEEQRDDILRPVAGKVDVVAGSHGSWLFSTPPAGCCDSAVTVRPTFDFPPPDRTPCARGDGADRPAPLAGELA